MKNAMSLKARIRNLAKQKNIPAQVILQNYMFEGLLARLSVSEYRDRFILKGGMLVAAIVGLDNRATMDLDTTLKNLPLTPESLKETLNSIISISVNDDIAFEIKDITPIRENDIYGGYRVSLIAVYDTMTTPLSIDVSTGDIITPGAIEYRFRRIFDPDSSFSLYSYNIETILAEKVETILRRSVFNTRPRDFYDAYILATTQNFDKNTFVDALRATAAHRGTSDQITDSDGIINTISESRELEDMWNKYRRQFSYAKDITFSDIVSVLRKLV